MTKVEPNAAVTWPRIERVEIIDGTGRAFVRHYDDRGAYAVIQDKGTTLKMFVSGEPCSETHDPGSER